MREEKERVERRREIESLVEIHREGKGNIVWNDES